MVAEVPGNWLQGPHSELQSNRPLASVLKQTQGFHIRPEATAAAEDQATSVQSLRGDIWGCPPGLRRRQEQQGRNPPAFLPRGPLDGPV